MATPAKRPKASNAEILEAYTRLKTKIKRTNDVAKQEGESMMRDFVTIGSGAGFGYYMAYVAKDETTPAAKKEAQQVGGLDLDMLISGGALAAGMFKWGGNMSDTLRAVGVGGLTQWGARLAASKVE